MALQEKLSQRWCIVPGNEKCINLSHVICMSFLFEKDDFSHQTKLTDFFFFFIIMQKADIH